MRFLLLAVTMATSFATVSHVWDQPSQGDWQTSDCNDSPHRGGWSDRARACEVRRTTLVLSGRHLGVTGKNGGITIVGEDRNDVAVEARVETWAGTEADASNLLHEVRIDTSQDQIRDHGPEAHSGHNGYSVSYRLHVPRALGAELRTMNGGIDIAHLEGDIAFETTNGGVELDDLSGNVHGATVNGGLKIMLTGDRWKGEGLHVRTTNGGVQLQVPQHYSAHLETGTVNGGVSVDFPVTVQGVIKNHLSTDIGGGGPVVQAETTNGGIEIRRG
jgi:hypothetical protein